MSKKLSIVLLTLLLLVVLLPLALVLWVDPNDYRDEITNFLRNKTGMELKLAGDVSWRFYPVLGFGAQQAGFAVQAQSPRLVTVDELVLGLELMPLFSGKIQADEIVIRGLSANLVLAADGSNNWSIKDASRAAASKPAADSPQAKPWPTLTIPLLRILDSELNYLDEGSGETRRVVIPSLVLENMKADEVFPLSLRVSYFQDQLQLPIELSASALLDSQQQRFSLQKMKLSGRYQQAAETPEQAPLNIAFNLGGDLVFDKPKDSLSLDFPEVKLADGLQGKLRVLVSSISDELSYSGRWQANANHLDELFASFGASWPLASNKPGSLQMDVPFKGDAASMSLTPLQFSFDETQLQGELALLDFSTQRMAFDLRVDNIDLYQYLPATSTSKAATGKTESVNRQAQPIEMPVELLEGLSLKGRLSVQEMRFQGIPVENISLQLRAENGLVSLNQWQLESLGGQAKGQFSLNAKAAQPKLQGQLDVVDMGLAPLFEYLELPKVLSGKMGLQMNVDSQGKQLETLFSSALGHINLSVNDGTLHGLNINQIAVNTLRQKLGDFSALYPGYQQKLPDSLREDTTIKNLLAKMTLKDGRLLLPDFKVVTGEGDVAVQGGVDLLAATFDSLLNIELKNLRDHRYLAGLQWPVRCSGRLTESPLNWCRPDQKGFEQLLEKAAKSALRNKSAEKLGNKLGLEQADEAAVKDALRDKAEAEEQRAKKKIREALGRELNKFLKSDQEKAQEKE